MIQYTDIQDISNDQMLVMELRTKMHDAINHARKLQSVQAIANGESLLDDYIQSLDDTITNVLQPFERLLDEAEQQAKAEAENDRRAA
jgi:hypothetical protein